MGIQTHISVHADSCAAISMCRCSGIGRERYRVVSQLWVQARLKVVVVKACLCLHARTTRCVFVCVCVDTTRDRRVCPYFQPSAILCRIAIFSGNPAACRRCRLVRHSLRIMFIRLETQRRLVIKRFVAGFEM